MRLAFKKNNLNERYDEIWSWSWMKYDHDHRAKHGMERLCIYLAEINQETIIANHHFTLTTLRESNVAIGNPLEMGVLIGKSPINSVFPIAMFDYRRVIIINQFMSKVTVRSEKALQCPMLPEISDIIQHPWLTMATLKSLTHIWSWLINDDWWWLNDD